MTVPELSEVGATSEPTRSRSRRLRGEAVLVAFGQAGAALVGLGGLRLLTTLLAPSEFGRLALGLSIAAFLQQVAFGPVASATLRYAGSAAQEGDLASFLMSLRRLLWQAVVLSAGMALCGAVLLYLLGLQDWIVLGVSSLWFAAATGTSTTFLFVDTSLRRRQWVAAVQVLSEVFRFGVAAGAIVAFGVHAASVTMLGFAAALTVTALWQVQRSRARRVQGSVESAEWRAALMRFATPLGLTGALSWSQLASDRWSLNAFLSSVSVGAYSVLYQIAIAPFSLLSVMLQQLIGPIVFRMAGRDGDEGSMRASHRVVVLAVFGVLGLTAIGALIALQFHELIFRILVGPKFREFSRLLPIAVCVGGALAASQLAGTTVMSRGDTTRLVAPKIVTSLVGVTLNIVGAKLYGVIGVLLANGAFGVMFFAWMMVLGSRPRAVRPVASGAG